MERSNRSWQPDGDGRRFQQTETLRTQYAAGQQKMRQWNAEILEYERMKAHYKGIGEEPPYSTLGTFRRAKRVNAQSYQEYAKSWGDKKGVEKNSTIVAENTKGEYKLTAIGEKSKENVETDNSKKIEKEDTREKHVYISNNLGKASTVLKEKFPIKSDSLIITSKQYETHIAKGANNHDDIFDEIKGYLPNIIQEPDYVFESDKYEDSVIFVSQEHKAQIVIKLNTKDENLANTIITIIGCGERTLKRLKKKIKILYQKGIDKD